MENKSIGGALVDVFDAGVSLVKSEITIIGRRVGNIAKAKGLGVVLLLAALVPLTLALIFLILFVYYGLIRLGLAPWSASLLIGIFSLIVTAGLIFFGLKKLGSDVPDGNDPPSNMSDIAKDDLKYGSAAGKTPTTAVSSQADVSARPGTTPTPAVADHSQTDHLQTGHTTGGHAVSNPPAQAHSVTAAQPVVQPARAPMSAPSGSAPQSTSTQGKPSGEAERSGIVVSTHPTYQDDMKKEGY
ncbi:phage holin family protein [Deinococcus radiomollis]|uniref:phage holin family protein n=1 Tax=Deinococcus radiomollis TaxID=468916 RepID=UPI0038926174